ncbi:MAG: hypothetical protein GEU73_00050 [Chloroflexi bacterium]|nr:hypothetical protein [Chloroflexota bacterium]
MRTWKTRSGGGTSIQFELGNSTLIAHVSEFPVGTYKKAHRHGPGASVVIVTGTGYSLHWHASDAYEKIPGSRPQPSFPRTWHSTNTSTPDRRPLGTWRFGGERASFGSFDLWTNGSSREMNEGGNQIEYQDEDPWIYRTYVEECAKHGVTPDMERLFARAGRRGAVSRGCDGHMETWM